MAEIPTYQPQVAPRPVGTPYDESRVPPGAFGAGVGEGLQQVADTAGEFARKAKADADASAVIGAIGQTKSALNSIILDPETGYASLKGTDALEGREKAWQKFQTAIANTESTLTNENQRRTFRLHALTIQEEGFRHVVSHEAAQIEDVARAKFRGAADETMRTLQSPQVISNPAEVDKNLADLKRLATAEAMRNLGRSASSDAIQSVVGPTMQKAAQDAMEAAVSSRNPDLAKSVFNQVQPYLGTHLGQYGRMVEALDAARQGDVAGLAIVRDAMGPDGQVDRRAAQDKVNAMPAGPVKDRAQHSVDHLAAVYDQAWKDEAHAMAGGVIDQATDPNGRLDMTLVNPASLEALRTKWPTKAAEIEKRALIDQRRAGLEDSKVRYAEALDTFLEDTESVARMKPEEFEATYRPQLEPQHYVQLRQKYDKLQRKVDVSPQEAAHVESVVFQETRKALGLGKAKRISDLSDEKKAAVTDLVQSVNARVREWSIVNRGAPFPPPEDLRKMVAEGMGPVVTGQATNDFEVLRNALPFVSTERTERRFQVEARQRAAAAQAQLAQPLPSPDAADEALAIPLPILQSGPAAHPLPTAIPLRAPSDEDLAAIDWLQKHPNDPAAAGVRARLRAKGIQ